MSLASTRFITFAGSGFLFALAFACLVWPGSYSYGRVGDEFYRLHKLTGAREWATDSGWVTTHELNQEHLRARQERLSVEVAQMTQALSDARAGRIPVVEWWHDHFVALYTDGTAERFDLSPYFTEAADLEVAMRRSGARFVDFRVPVSVE